LEKRRRDLVFKPPPGAGFSFQNPSQNSYAVVYLMGLANTILEFSAQCFFTWSTMLCSKSVIELKENAAIICGITSLGFVFQV